MAGAAFPEPLTGGTTAGLWFGIAGAALMIYAGLLAAHRRLARWPLLPRRSWMLKGHIWLGLLSFWLILCHSNFRWGGPLEQLLWIVFGLVVLSGIVGLVLQGVLPRLMVEQIEEETPYEQMPHVCRQLARGAAQLAEALSFLGTGDAAAKANTGRGQLRTFYEVDIAPFLGGAAPLTSALHDTARRANGLPSFERCRSLQTTDQSCLSSNSFATGAGKLQCRSDCITGCMDGSSCTCPFPWLCWALARRTS